MLKYLEYFERIKGFLEEFFEDLFHKGFLAKFVSWNTKFHSAVFLLN